jgi:catechol 2,3-dioxygenase-like lactoylglutathione lyase family enzyme
MSVDPKFDFSAIAGPTKSPSKLAHVVFRTKSNAAMKDFYTKFLGARVNLETGPLCFMTYDDEHHRLAFFEDPRLEKQTKENVGFEVRRENIISS